MSTLLIPLAGAGQRFVDAGYKIPKPLIEVSGLPMVVQAALAMPKCSRHIFLCRKEHLQSSPLESVLLRHFPKCEIVPVDYLTDGQASTCLLAKNSIDLDAPLHIGACDNSMVYNRRAFETMFQDTNTEAVVWGFSGNPTVTFNPKAYGWIKDVSSQPGVIEKVSCKVPISSHPIADSAVVGAFSFKRGRDFIDAAEKMIADNGRVNGEFYVDHAINYLPSIGRKVLCFKVDHYICWGTPNDLRTFEYWQKFFDSQPSHPYKIARDVTYAKK